MISRNDPKAALAAKKENEIWLYSYADLITNLLAFFIMLLVISKGGAGTAQKIQESIAKVVAQGSGQGKTDVNNSIAQIIKDNHLEEKMALQKTADGLSLTFSGGLFFDTSSAELTPDAKVLLGKIAPIFKQVKAGHRIDIEGHADSRPIQKNDVYPSNWELSAARAGSVVRFLSEQGIDSHRMRAIGYADTRPISDDLKLNRRVVISIGNGMP